MTSFLYGLLPVVIECLEALLFINTQGRITRNPSITYWPYGFRM